MRTNIAIFIGLIVVAFFIALYAQFKQGNLSGIPEYPTELKQKQPSQNYTFQDGKLLPLTVLSPEDAKRPCNECHRFGF